METHNITLASNNDYKIVQLIGKETFFETFASSNTEADMKKYLSESFSEEKIKKELSNKESMFFIVWDSEVPIGYLKINTGDAQTELQDTCALEIERIYVKANYHGKKIGQLLYDKALEVAQQKHLKSIWLGVWEENPKAIKFYEKNGFIAFDKHVFKMGNDIQTDIMMRKILT
ncbi:GNAT family N-acetyltransferase [Pedobacter lithocola]|uniref:GNAT family N-acetyltransferase n=1 Tax=Pedobacter lithocola TaxID=1908239 RepID=A0ABV8PDQ6_9SPHI